MTGRTYRRAVVAGLVCVACLLCWTAYELHRIRKATFSIDRQTFGADYSLNDANRTLRAIERHLSDMKR